MADAALNPRYTVLPKSCIDLWVESVGIPKLSDDASTILAEDVSYRIRESIHNALRIMKHCKRSFLTTEDFNNALKESNTELVYGHGGMGNPSFKSVSFKEGRLCYIEEKEVNLREIGLETSCPPDPGEVSVKASWLALEGHECSSGKAKEDHKASLKEPISSYLTNITSALVGKISHLRKIALKDLALNKKLQVVLPHLVSFFSSQIKQHTGKDSFSLIASYILLSINAIVENQSILLTPYVFQLVKIMLFIVVEAKIPVAKWLIKVKAAHVLAHLCRKQNLDNQLLKSYQDSLSDKSRPLSYIYGAIVGVNILGVEAVESTLYPIMREKLKLFSEKQASVESNEEMIELAALKSAFANAASLLFTEKLIDNSSENNVKNGISYNELYEELGEEFMLCCTRSNHKCASNTDLKLAPLTKNNTPLNINKSNRRIAITLLINNKVEELKKIKEMEFFPVEDNIVSRIIINDVVSPFTSNRRKLREPHSIFKDEQETLDWGGSGIPCKKQRKCPKLNIVKKVRGLHPSYRHKHKCTKDIMKISNFLPTL